MYLLILLWQSSLHPLICQSDVILSQCSKGKCTTYYLYPNPLTFSSIVIDKILCNYMKQFSWASEVTEHQAEKQRCDLCRCDFNNPQQRCHGCTDTPYHTPLHHCNNVTTLAIEGQRQQDFQLLSRCSFTWKVNQKFLEINIVAANKCMHRQYCNKTQEGKSSCMHWLGQADRHAQSSLV